MSLHRLTRSIVTRIILLGVGIVVVGAIARFYLLSGYLRDELGRSVAAQQVSLAEYVAGDIAEELEGRQTLVRELAASLPLTQLRDPQALYRWLRERHRLLPLFTHGVIVTDVQGRTLAAYADEGKLLRVDFAGSAFWQVAVRGEPALGHPQRWGPTQEPVLPMAAPVRDASGKVRAIVVGMNSLRNNGFLHLPHTDVIGAGSSFLLISTSQRLFLASSDASMVLTSTPAHGINPLHDRAMEGYRGSGFTTNAQGVEEISGIASVRGTDWFVVARIPAASAFAAVQRAQRFVAGNSVVVLAIFLAFTVGGLLTIFKPLFQAADHADRMSRGEAPLEQLPVVRDDEVGHLTLAFNRLIVKLQQNQVALERAAHHDALTGLPNRALLADRLRQALALAHRGGHHIAVLYLDLDGFKPINDALGHAAGDEALKEVARRLQALVREADTVARMGGDEFMIVMGELDADQELARAAACGVAAKCLQAFVQPLTLEHGQCPLGLSIGVAVGDGKSRADVLRNAADAAMYKAKNAGGRQFLASWTLTAPDNT